MARATIIFNGHVGAEPEQKFLPDGKMIVNIRVAVNSKDKNGEKTDWYAVSCWGRLADVVSGMVTKGTHVLVMGTFNPSVSTGKDGRPYLNLNVNASEIQILAGGRKTSLDDVSEIEF
jgi:single-strand DNA-binding protein